VRKLNIWNDRPRAPIRVRRAKTGPGLSNLIATADDDPEMIARWRESLQRDGVSTRLTGTEFRLLHFLMSQSGAVVPTSAIARADRTGSASSATSESARCASRIST